MDNIRYRKYLPKEAPPLDPDFRYRHLDARAGRIVEADLVGGRQLPGQERDQNVSLLSC